MDISIKEVRFDKYCKKCKYAKTSGSDEPCNTCMEVFAREGTIVPLKFKESSKSKVKSQKKQGF